MLLDHPSQAGKRYAVLEGELSELLELMKAELEDQRILNWRPPFVDEVYPLIEQHLRAANEDLCRRFEIVFAKIVVQIEQLRYLIITADSTELHRAADFPDAHAHSSFDVAQAMEAAFDELEKIVNWTNKQMAQAEVEASSRVIRYDSILPQDFQMPSELDSCVIDLAAKRRQSK